VPGEEATFDPVSNAENLQKQKFPTMAASSCLKFLHYLPAYKSP
jgi:hypothetical protein